jgi:hypothetical protein
MNYILCKYASALRAVCIYIKIFLFEADLKKSKLMSGVQKIILMRLEEERDEEFPTLD